MLLLNSLLWQCLILSFKYNNIMIWYTSLIKPPLTPPAWLFAPTWIILYLTILTSLVLYTTTKSRYSKCRGYIYFIVQMFLNLIWLPIFFVFKNVELALIGIIFLDGIVYFTIKEFRKVSKFASFALYPYFIWIIFATYLNLGLLILN